MPSTIIERYNKILQGEQKRFSPYEFEDVRYRKQKIQMILRYVIEQVLALSPERARRELDFETVKGLKLHLVSEYITPPIEAKSTDVYYLVDYAYPYLPRSTEKEKTLWVYTEVLDGTRRHFPLQYFQSLKGEERAKTCFDYMCKELLHIEDMDLLPTIFSKNEQAYHILRKYKLKILLDALFFSPYDLITEMYPQYADPALWENSDYDVDFEEPEH